MNFINLPWKEFNVNLEKVKKTFKADLSTFDGFICDTASINVMFTSEISQDDIAYVTNYWESITPLTFAQTTEEYIANVVIPNTKSFVSHLEQDFVTRNISLGISAAGKTGAVLSVISKQVMLPGEDSPVSLLDTLYGVCPSLTVTIKVLDYHISIIDQYSSLSPFITAERFTEVKNRIQTFLGVPLT